MGPGSLKPVSVRPVPFLAGKLGAAIPIPGGRSGNAQGVGPSGAWLEDSVTQRLDTWWRRAKQCRCDPSVESVHEFRVATRRLIAQITLLRCVQPGVRVGWVLRELKQERKALSPLRDHHIQSAFIDHYFQFALGGGLKQRAKHAGKGLSAEAKLAACLVKREHRFVAAAGRMVHKFPLKRVRKKVRALLKEAVGPKTGVSPVLANRRAVALCRSAWTEVERRFSGVDLDQPETVHCLRTAFRQFRYIAETLPASLTGLTPQALRRFAIFQRRMGRIQDLEAVELFLRDYIHENGDSAGSFSRFRRYLSRCRGRARAEFKKSCAGLADFLGTSNSGAKEP